MNAYNILVLTDFSSHNPGNAIYPLLPALLADPRCASMDVASRHLDENTGFFYNHRSSELQAAPVGSTFSWHNNGKCYTERLRPVNLKDYDVIFIRLPHPTSTLFWDFLKEVFPPQQIVNQPSGIQKCGDKTFLFEVQEWCPPMRLCLNLEDVQSFLQQFPIVLKPLRGFRGKGILRLDETWIWQGDQRIPFKEWAKLLNPEQFPMLGMQYLRKIQEGGDKRILVCNGKIIGGYIRMPSRGSWLANIAQGGGARDAEIEPEEEAMVKAIDPLLKEKGVVIYGLDTLLDDEGVRKLSEINVQSVGGLEKIQRFSSKAIAVEVSTHLWNYIDQEIYAPNI